MLYRIAFSVAFVMGGNLGWKKYIKDKASSEAVSFNRTPVVVLGSVTCNGLTNLSLMVQHRRL